MNSWSDRRSASPCRRIAVSECRGGIVDRAGTDDHRQAVVEAVDDRGDRLTSKEHDLFEHSVEGELPEDLFGRDERADRFDPAIPNR